MKFIKNQQFTPPKSRNKRAGAIKNVEQLRWKDKDLNIHIVGEMDTQYIKNCLKRVRKWETDRVWVFLNRHEWIESFEKALELRGETV